MLKKLENFIKKPFALTVIKDNSSFTYNNPKILFDKNRLYILNQSEPTTNSCLIQYKNGKIKEMRINKSTMLNITEFTNRLQIPSKIQLNTYIIDFIIEKGLLYCYHYEEELLTYFNGKHIFFRYYELLNFNYLLQVKVRKNEITFFNKNSKVSFHRNLVKNNLVVKELL